MFLETLITGSPVVFDSDNIKSINVESVIDNEEGKTEYFIDLHFYKKVNFNGETNRIRINCPDSKLRDLQYNKLKELLDVKTLDLTSGEKPIKQLVAEEKPPRKFIKRVNPQDD